MKLKEILSEMSLPTMTLPKALETIRQAYNFAVVKKQPNNDLYGPLVAALKFLQKVNNPEAYQKEIKMGIAAKKVMDKTRNKLSKAQAQFTTVK